MARIWVSVFCSLILCSIFVESASAGPFVVQYSALLTNKDKQPRTDLVGRTVYFRLYSTETAGNQLWQESHSVTTTNTKGFVSVALGSNAALPLKSIDTCSSLWLEMQIAEEPVFPRQQLTATMFALRSKNADSAHFSETALVSKRANRADTLGNRPAETYALVSQIPAVRTRIDSASYADTSRFARSATIPNSAISTANLQDSSVTGAKIKNGTITDTDIANSASISGSKISPIFGNNGRIRLHDHFSNASQLFMQGSLTPNHRVMAMQAVDSAFMFYMTRTPFDPLDPNHGEPAGSVQMYFGRPNVLIVSGGIYTNSNITAEGNISCNTLTQTSDRRLKKNINPIENALHRVLQLNGVTFEWNNEKQSDSGKQIGLLAQDVEKVFPEVVRSNAEGTKSVAYQNLIPVLIDALKEQQNAIGLLEDKIEGLQKELKALRRQEK